MIIPGQVDMLPLERPEVRQRLIRDGLPALAERRDRPLQGDGVPEHDGGDHQVQPTRPVPLVLVGGDELPVRRRERVKLFELAQAGR